MKLKHPLLLRKAFEILEAIACNPSEQSAEHARIENRIHIEWHEEPKKAVTLTATDGHRACFITLAGDPAFPYRPGQALIVAPETDRWPKLAQLDTLFVSSAGTTCAMGYDPGQPMILPPNAPAPQVRQWGVDLGVHPAGPMAFPIETLWQIRDSVKQSVGSVRMMEINPEYVQDGLSIVTSFWDRATSQESPRRFDFHIPGHVHAPLMLESQFPRENPPTFHIAYVIMPYRKP